MTISVYHDDDRGRPPLFTFDPKTDVSIDVGEHVQYDTDDGWFALLVTEVRHYVKEGEIVEIALYGKPARVREKIL
jgi:hypothetical protein